MRCLMTSHYKQCCYKQLRHYCALTSCNRPVAGRFSLLFRSCCCSKCCAPNQAYTAAQHYNKIDVLASNAALYALQGIDTVNDALLYQCKTLMADATSAQLASAQTATAAATANLTMANIDPAAFIFTSRPGAPYKLWLDFVGSVVTGTGDLPHQHTHGSREAAAVGLASSLCSGWVCSSPLCRMCCCHMSSYLLHKAS
jgi:hypothetical protein